MAKHNQCCLVHGCTSGTSAGDGVCPVVSRKQKPSGVCHRCDLEDAQVVTRGMLHEYLRQNLSLTLNQTYSGGYRNEKYVDVSLQLTNPRTGESETISSDSFCVPD
jgi:hypothetical protein